MNTRSPGCEAVMVQVPVPESCTVDPETVHWPLAVKATGKPELETAVTVKSWLDRERFGREANEMDWSARVQAVLSS